MVLYIIKLIGLNLYKINLSLIYLNTESELVSGFMTEHAAVVFVFFFLAEYGSILLMCILSAVLFLGGYLYYIPDLTYLVQFVDFDLWLYLMNNGDIYDLSSYPLVEGLIYGLFMGIKSCFFIFTFIWVRASFPRVRFDQLMSFCWTVLLPILFAFIVSVPCLLHSLGALPISCSLF